MHRIGLLVLVAISVVGYEKFFEKYTYGKTMTQCFGHEAYFQYLRAIADAERECNSYNRKADRPTTDRYPDHRLPATDRYPDFRPSSGDRRFPNDRFPDYEVTTRRPFYRPANTKVSTRPIHVVGNSYDSRGNIPTYSGTFQPIPDEMDFLNGYDRSKSQHGGNQRLYDSYAIRKALGEISNALRNFTCVLTKLQLIDVDLNINFAFMINNYYASRINVDLRDDLIRGVQYCQQLTSCLPGDKSPISIELQRIMAFVKCERKVRLAACFKHDLRNNLHHFETSALPDDGYQSTDIEKLMTILIGSESLDQLDLF